MKQLLIFGSKYKCCSCGKKTVVVYQPYISCDDPEDELRIDNGRECNKCQSQSFEELERYTEPVVWKAERDGKPSLLIAKHLFDNDNPEDLVLITNE